MQLNAPQNLSDSNSVKRLVYGFIETVYYQNFMTVPQSPTLTGGAGHMVKSPLDL